MDRKFILALMAGAAMALASSCGTSGTADEASAEAAADTTVCTDLALHELHGPVKECTKTSYFDVKLDGDSYTVVDTVGDAVISSTARFDEQGRYIKKENESIRRDEMGRIVRWEDHRPNAENVPGGFLKDTLEYKYVNGNHLVSTGMGAYAVIVYDDEGKVVGQYTAPELTKTYTSAFNVYKKFDKKGNWTERLTIWSTMGAKDSIPHLNYSVDRREIIYY